MERRHVQINQELLEQVKSLGFKNANDFIRTCLETKAYENKLEKLFKEQTSRLEEVLRTNLTPKSSDIPDAGIGIEMNGHSIPPATDEDTEMDEVLRHIFNKGYEAKPVKLGESLKALDEICESRQGRSWA